MPCRCCSLLLIFNNNNNNNCFHFIAALLASRGYSHGKQETDEEFDARWVTYFNKPDIDAWELRKGVFMGEYTSSNCYCRKLSRKFSSQVQLDKAKT